MQNDENTVHQIVQNQASVYRFILSLVGNYSDAEDLLQQTMLTVWQKRTQGITEEILPWMFTIARNHVRNHVRKLNRRGDVTGLNEDCLERIAAVHQNLPRRTSDQQQALDGCLEQLPSEKRKLLEAHYKRQLTIEQIAATFSRNVEAAYKSLQRIRRTLFDCINRSLADGDLS